MIAVCETQLHIDGWIGERSADFSRSCHICFAIKEFVVLCRGIEQPEFLCGQVKPEIKVPIVFCANHSIDARNTFVSIYKLKPVERDSPICKRDRFIFYAEGTV